MQAFWPIGIQPGKVATLIGDLLEGQDKNMEAPFIAINAHEGVRIFKWFGFGGPETASEIKNRLHINELEEVNLSEVKGERLLQDLREIFCKVFDLTGSEYVDEAQVGLWNPWSSLRHVDLMMTLEQDLGINIPDEKISTLTSFRKIYSYLSQVS